MLALVFIIIGTTLRLLPHMPNFAPVTALALFGGVYLNKKYAVLIPLICLIISDYFLGSLFYASFLFVWGSFIISGLIGLYLRNHKKPLFILGGSLIASIQFFIITNFGVWAQTPLYTKNLNGLAESYIMGIPFFKYTLLGDLFYTAAFFGSFALIQALINVSQKNHIFHLPKH